jgi:hypothetical protein
MRFHRFMVAVTLSGPPKTVTIRKGFGYLKPALRWVHTWVERETFTFADIEDIERNNPAWNSRDGLLLDYRTVKPEDALPIRKRAGVVRKLRKVEAA